MQTFMNRYMVIVLLIAISCGMALAREITENGMRQGELVVFLTQIQTSVNQLRTAAIANKVTSDDAVTNLNKVKADVAVLVTLANEVKTTAIANRVSTTDAVANLNLVRTDVGNISTLVNEIRVNVSSGTFGPLTATDSVITSAVATTTAIPAISAANATVTSAVATTTTIPAVTATALDITNF